MTEVRLAASTKLGPLGSCPVGEAGRARVGVAASRCPSPLSAPPTHLPLWKPRGPLTWGHQGEGAALGADVIFGLALVPVGRLGQWEGEVGRLPVVWRLLHVDAPVLPDQVVGDGWAARGCLAGHFHARACPSVQQGEVSLQLGHGL